MQLSIQTAMPEQLQDKQALYDWLTGLSDGGELADLVARMLASQFTGSGDMPQRLGLTRLQFASLMEQLFGLEEIESFAAKGSELDLTRTPEHKDLRDLFLEHVVAGITPQVSEWVADMLVAGCMGGDHLWQDLGLWSRNDLSALIRHAFAPLADKNTQDMKWKKFFYKQLCIREGVYVCRAPSCQVCADYANCYGPE